MDFEHDMNAQGDYSTTAAELLAHLFPHAPPHQLAPMNPTATSAWTDQEIILLIDVMRQPDVLGFIPAAATMRAVNQKWDGYVRGELPTTWGPLRDLNLKVQAAAMLFQLPTPNTIRAVRPQGNVAWKWDESKAYLEAAVATNGARGEMRTWLLAHKPTHLWRPILAGRPSVKVIQAKIDAYAVEFEEPLALPPRIHL